MSYKKMLPLVLAALLLWTVPASAAPETTLKVAVGDPEDSEMGVVGHAFKKYVEEKTGGKVEVQCFYGGSLGDESEAFRNVQKGTLPLAMGGIANLVPFEKKLGLLTLPYLFANIDEVVAGTNGAPAELLNKYATKAGFRILSWAETFTALQQGVVDGQCYGYIGFKAMKFNEANQKYLTEVHYTYQLQPLVISERVFKKMTPEMQKVIVDAGKYAQDAVLKFQLENAEAAKKELIAGGLVVSQLEDEDLWKAAIEKVWPEMADFVGGKDAINEYLKACGKDAWK